MDEPRTDAASASKAWHGPRVPRRWQQFFCCLMFHFALPLLPLGAELLQDGKISPSSLTFGSAVYVMALGASSRNEAIFGISVLLGVIYTSLFGMLRSPTANMPIPATLTAVKWSVGLVVVFHLIERFSRHVTDRAPFFEFMRKNSEDLG